MKKQNRFVTCLSFCFAIAVALLLPPVYVFAQDERDIANTQNQRDLDYLQSQQANERLRRQAEAGNSGAYRGGARRNRVNRIKNGTATNRFVPSLSGYESTARSIDWEPGEPTTITEQIKFLQAQVKRFEARMIKAGYKPNDTAEAATFAYALSLEAYTGKPLTAKEWQELEKTRLANREFQLTNETYQRAWDEEKQHFYILDAIMSLQAIEWREKARAARTESERRAAEAEIAIYAKRSLKIE